MRKWTKKTAVLNGSEMISGKVRGSLYSGMLRALGDFEKQIEPAPASTSATASTADTALTTASATALTAGADSASILQTLKIMDAKLNKLLESKL